MASPEDGKMSFWGHLDELRKRLVNVSIAIGVGFVLCFAYSEQILGLLLLPMNATISFSSQYPFIAFTPNKIVQTLHFTALTEPFMSHLKIGFISGIMLMIPSSCIRSGCSSRPACCPGRGATPVSSSSFPRSSSP